MGTQQGQEFCRACNRLTLHTRQKPVPHLLHLFLTLLTCGGWFAIWLIHDLVVGASEPWRCSRCGSNPKSLTPAEVQQLYRAKAIEAGERTVRRAEQAKARRQATTALWAAMYYHVGAAGTFLFDIAPWIDRTLWRILGRENVLLVRFLELLAAFSLLVVIGLLMAIAWELTGQLVNHPC